MTICINKKGSSVPVYSNYGLTTWGSKVGTVNSNELFVFMGRLQKQMVQFQSVFIHLQVGDKDTSNQVLPLVHF